jgi:TolB-like protein
MMSCVISSGFYARNSETNLVHYRTGMSTETIAMRLCLKCGAKMFAGEKVCGACLLESGLGLLAEDDLDLGVPQNTTDFGDYELREEIGRGGQGVVYRALQKSLNRTVALKVIGLGRWAATPHLKRFRQEAEAAARLEHPQIVPIYEIGERDGSCYYSMKFIEGGRLDEVVRREPVSPRRAAELLVKIARTVQFAHERGILHRDIKPGNILLDQYGEPHLTDFGLARLIEQESTITNSFDVLGTPSYMAPEQAAGKTKELTPAADVYSLGAAFYQMLTSQPPFAGGTTYETIRMVLETEPRNPRLWNPKVDADLATICLKCLEKDPRRRYESAAALADDVERWLRHEPISARRTGKFARTGKWIRRNPATAVLVPALAALVAALGVIFWISKPAPPATGIAVLPFENLSADKEKAFFADGMQDDILTKLAKVADLKVISRTSVMQYRGARNIPQIASALRVSHVLEGSVRREGDKIHLNAQLIDARTDRHVWAEEYDRGLNEVFAIQSDVAQKVAAQLHARLSPAEKQSIERPTSGDIAAFDLFSRGKNLLAGAAARENGKDDLLGAVDLLDQAVARDPSFAQAYGQLAWANDLLYYHGHDHTPARLARAEAAIDAMSRLQPEAGETHLARAENIYRGYLNYEGALSELELARQSLPNDARVFETTAYIKRRQGKYEEALPNLERALELDPRNIYMLQQLAIVHSRLRRFTEKRVALERILLIDPNNTEALIDRAGVELYTKADVRPLHQVLESILARNPELLPRIANERLDCALLERDFATAKEILAALRPRPAFNDGPLHFNYQFGEGFIARMTGDEVAARSAFLASRAEQEKVVRDQPDYAPSLMVLGVIDAALGRKEEAFREGRRAMELLPMAKDAVNGLLIYEYFALIAGWVGEKNLACEQLETALRYPSSTNYGELKLSPWWDPLRGDPRFEKIVASLAPL